MSIYFVLKLRIFVMMKSNNSVCYFVLKMFVMMGNISDVCFLCLMYFPLLCYIIR